MWELSIGIKGNTSDYYVSGILSPPPGLEGIPPTHPTEVLDEYENMDLNPPPFQQSLPQVVCLQFLLKHFGINYRASNQLLVWKVCMNVQLYLMLLLQLYLLNPCQIQ